MNNLFCIIQGPVITKGQGPNRSLEGFNSKQTILANIAKLDSLGIQYVFVCWQDDFETLENSFVENINIIGVKNPYTFDRDHRFKHHFAIDRGLEYCRNTYQAEDADYILKIRSDMLMPESFWQFISAYKNIGDKLLVSELYTPFYLGDFVYLAKFSVLKGYVNAMIEKYPKIYSPNIQCDLGFGYFYLSRGNSPGPFKYIIPTIAYCFFYSRLYNTWETFINNHLTTLPEDIWNGIIWRDNLMSGKIDSKNFYFASEGEYNKRIVKRNFGFKEYIWGLRNYRSKK